MGGQGQVTDWNDLAQVRNAIDGITGLTPAEREKIAAGMRAAIAREPDTVKKVALSDAFRSLIEGATSGGIGGVLNAALALLI